jgi:hypothetical protein
MKKQKMTRQERGPKYRNPHQRKFEQRAPKDEREVKFCALIARGLLPKTAWGEAGYAKTTGVEPIRKVEQLRQYIDKLREKATEIIAKKYVLDQPTVLNAMFDIAFANPQDYEEEYEFEEKNATDGSVRKVKRSRLKPLQQLTRQQAGVVDNVREGPDGRLIYDLPALALRKSAQKDLGQHLGLFHPKLIQEHRHQHLHQHLTLKGVNMDDLRAGRDVLRKALGPRADLMLGFRPEQPDDDEQDVTPEAVERAKSHIKTPADTVPMRRAPVARKG